MPGTTTDLDKCTGGEVGADQINRQMAPSETCAEKITLRVQIIDEPIALPRDGLPPPPRVELPIGDDELHEACQLIQRHRSVELGELM